MYILIFIKYFDIDFMCNNIKSISVFLYFFYINNNLLFDFVLNQYIIFIFLYCDNNYLFFRFKFIDYNYY